jgi:hypothetical protein
LRNDKKNSFIWSRLIQGTVLLANSDKRAIAYQAAAVVGEFEETICVYTGEINPKRIFLL